MRICLLAAPWVPVPPPAYGGSEAVLDTLARGLQRAGHDVLLVASGDSTCPVPTSSVYAEAIGLGGGPAVELRHVVHGYDAAAEWGAEIVHDHTLTGPVFGRQLSSIPVVTTNHGPFADDELGPFYRSIAEDIPVIAISHHHAATAAPTRIAEVIHHGVDLDGFPVGDGSGDYALFLGRMVPEKGVHTAIRAARLAGRPLVVAAKMREHHEQAYFEAEVEPLLGAGIEFVGEADAAEKLELLAGAACLLNPIDWPEPFGMVMAEALACGTPVLAHPRGSVPEIVDDGVTGFLRHHLDGLASCLHRVGELDRAACRQAVQERFSADRMVTAHIELYERVVGQATGRPEATAARRGRQR